MATAKELLTVKGATNMFDPLVPGMIESTKNTFTVTSSNVVSVDDVTVAEGTGAGTTNATFHVTLAAPASGTVTVNAATSNGTATQPAGWDCCTRRCARGPSSGPS